MIRHENSIYKASAEKVKCYNRRKFNIYKASSEKLKYSEYNPRKFNI